MSKKFALFVAALTIAVILLFPYNDITWVNFLKLLGGVFFAGVAGVLNWKDIEERYEEMMK